jgi:hypothetical protein
MVRSVTLNGKSVVVGCNVLLHTPHFMVCLSWFLSRTPIHRGLDDMQ